MTPTPFQLLRDALMDFVERESELAKAEIIPSAKQAGIGSAYVAGASAFLLHAIWMLVVTFGFGIGWLLDTFTGLGLLGSFTLGFLLGAVVSLAIAAVLALLARKRFRRVKAPEATIAEAKATFIALTDAAAGQAAPHLPVVLPEPTPPEPQA